MRMGIITKHTNTIYETVSLCNSAFIFASWFGMHNITTRLSFNAHQKRGIAFASLNLTLGRGDNFQTDADLDVLKAKRG